MFNNEIEFSKIYKVCLLGTRELDSSELASSPLTKFFRCQIFEKKKRVKKEKKKIKTVDL